jgi:lysophospholipase L1-like esterase
LLLGAGAVLAGLFGRRLPGLYRDTAVMLLNALLLLVAFEAASIVTVTVLRQWGGAEPAAEARLHPELLEQHEVSYYRDSTWSRQFWREHARASVGSHYEPFTVWTSPTFHGRYVNVGPDFRRVTPGSACDDRSQKLFVFGGSATWGYGSPDSGTIPAQLQRLLNADASPVCVTNFGQGAYVSTQELIALMRELQAGRVPDLVVLHDGFNDASVTVQTGRVDEHYQFDEIAARFESRESRDSSVLRPLVQATATYALLRRLHVLRSTVRPGFAQFPVRVPAASVEVFADSVVRVYLANVKILDALARAYGFQYHVFFQPSQFSGSKPLAREERSLAPSFVGAERLVSAVSRRIAAHAARDPHVTHLGSVFDSVTTSIYIDAVHLTPDGNRIIARAIRDVLVAKGLLHPASRAGGAVRPRQRVGRGSSAGMSP